MHASSKLIPLLLFAFLFAPAPAQPQVLSSPGEKNHLDFEVLGTVADGNLKGVTRDRKLTTFELAYRRTLTQHRVAAVDFKSAIVPLAILREPFLRGADAQLLQSVPPFTQMRNSFGLGAKPLGGAVRFLPERRFQPFVEIDGGFLYFNRNVLSEHAAQFNFTLEGRTGVCFPLGREQSIVAGYAFLHMSNAYTAAENPGVDAHMLFFAYSIPFPHVLSRKH
jgi:hypothetical protein